MNPSNITKRPPLHVLRGILRSLKVSGKDNNNNNNKTSITKTTAMNRKYILEQYRSNASISPEKAEPLRRLALEYYNLRKDLAERARLHSLDTGAENQLSPMEMSRRAAARAGLQLPDLHNPK